METQQEVQPVDNDKAILTPMGGIPVQEPVRPEKVNKYAPKPRIGERKDTIKTVGLGKLKVTTAHGTTTNSDV